MVGRGRLLGILQASALRSSSDVATGGTGEQRQHERLAMAHRTSAGVVTHGHAQAGNG